MFRSFGIVVFFHVGVSGIDDGLGEVNQGSMMILYCFDKLVAPDGRIVAFFLLSTIEKV